MANGSSYLLCLETSGPLSGVRGVALTGGLGQEIQNRILLFDGDPANKFAVENNSATVAVDDSTAVLHH